MIDLIKVLNGSFRDRVKSDPGLLEQVFTSRESISLRRIFFKFSGFISHLLAMMKYTFITRAAFSYPIEKAAAQNGHNVKCFKKKIKKIPPCISARRHSRTPRPYLNDIGFTRGFMSMMCTTPHIHRMMLSRCLAVCCSLRSR